MAVIEEKGEERGYLPIAFFHEMEGRGFPSALQSIVISFPKIVLLSNGSDDHLGGSFLCLFAKAQRHTGTRERQT